MKPGKFECSMDGEDENISIDSFNNELRSEFMFDQRNDFNLLLAKIRANDVKSIDEFDYQLLLSSSCENLEQFPQAFAEFVTEAID
jgi:hypothetical protein